MKLSIVHSLIGQGDYCLLALSLTECLPEDCLYIVLVIMYLLVQ